MDCLFISRHCAQNHLIKRKSSFTSRKQISYLPYREKELPIKTQDITEDFFREEYGRMVSVIARYFSDHEIEKAEGIVQETILEAIQQWRRIGVPNNPRVWMYQRAQNLSLNTLRLEKNFHEMLLEDTAEAASLIEFDFSEESILDEQLHMMFACCDQSLPEQTQIVLLLKLLCGLSVGQIAEAFDTKTEIIDHRLHRGREKLQENGFQLQDAEDYLHQQPNVLKCLHLLFDASYRPGIKDKVLQPLLSDAAIQLVKILIDHPFIVDKGSSHSLLSLMYLNLARSNDRFDELSHILIDRKYRDRKLWNPTLIQMGLEQLTSAVEFNTISPYLIQACISAEHCTAPDFSTINWSAIMDLYDQLIFLVDEPIHRMNRAVALTMTNQLDEAIEELALLSQTSTLSDHPQLHATLAMLYEGDHDNQMAMHHYKMASNQPLSAIDQKFVQQQLKKLQINC